MVSEIYIKLFRSTHRWYSMNVGHPFDNQLNPSRDYPSLDASGVGGGEPHKITAVLTIVVRRNTHSSARSLTRATCFQSNSVLSRRSCSIRRRSFLSMVACTLPRTRDHCASRPPSFPRSRLGLLLLLSSLLDTYLGDTCCSDNSGLQWSGQLFFLLGSSAGSCCYDKSMWYLGLQSRRNFSIEEREQ